MRIRTLTRTAALLMAGASLSACTIGWGERDQYAELQRVEQDLKSRDEAVDALHRIADTTIDRGVQREALESLGRHYRKAGEEARARGYLEGAVALGSTKAAMELAEMDGGTLTAERVAQLHEAALDRPEKGYDIAGLLEGHASEGEIDRLRREAVFDLERRVLKGETSALRRLAEIDLQQGGGNTSRHVRLAEKRLRKAAGKGDESAIMTLSDMLAGQGRQAEAEALLVSAEQSGYPSANKALARHYEEFATQDPTSAREAAERYAAIGMSENRMDYIIRAGNLYEMSSRGSDDAAAMQKARDMWRIAGDAGNADGYYRIGRSWKDINEAEAHIAFLRAAEMDHVEGSREAGRYLIDNGTGAGDYSRAEVFLAYAAENGDAAAKYSLGKIFDERGSANDFREAELLFSQSFQAGYGAAAKYLAKYAALGVNGEVSAEAADTYLAALDRDKAGIEAYKFGDAYADGDDVPRNRAVALAWFEKAVALNATEAMPRTVKSIYQNEDLFDLQTRLAWRDRMAAEGMDVSYFDDKEAVYARKREMEMERREKKSSKPSDKKKSVSTGKMMARILEGDPATLPSRAASVQRELAAGGNYEMMHRLGLRLVSNTGEHANKAGVGFLRTAADAKQADAALWVADARMAGLLSDQMSVADTNKYYEIAAEGGIASAQFVTGSRYLEGTFGQSKDMAKARRWLQRARDGGDLRAEQKLKTLSN